MPSDSIVMDLWDWDIHFEEESFPDLAEALFADEGQLLEYAGYLTEDFLRWIEKFDMDYNQHGWEPGEFEKWIAEECLLFMRKWQENVRAKCNR